MNLHTCLFMAMLGPIAFAGTTWAQTTVTYSESNEVLSNPERGLFVYGGDEIDHSPGCWWNDKTKFDTFVSRLQGAESDGIRLVYLQYDIGQYRDSSVISQSFLKCIQADFEAVRANGLKAILRFAYNPRKHVNDCGKKCEYESYENVGSNPYEASAETIKNHLSDSNFVKLIKDNADLIAVWQAGFLGRNGEWYNTATDEGIPEKPNMKIRAKLLTQMLEILPPPGIVQVRTPYYRQYALKFISMHDAANRLGVFDDAFFDKDQPSESNTYGSYQDPENPSPGSEDVKYWQGEMIRTGLIAPIGGESSDRSNARKPNKTQRKQILDEFAAYRWSFFNADKLTKTKTTDWSSLGRPSDSTIEKSLGYRLWLSESTLPQNLKAGADAAVSFTINNSGWAAPFSPRNLEVFLCPENTDMRGGADCRNPTKGRLSSNQDVKTWLPCRQIAIVAHIPTAGLPNGKYSIYFSLVDRSPRLAADPRYSMRLANNEDANYGWNATLGFNRIGEVNIQ